MVRCIPLFFAVLICLPVSAKDYPDMVGLWKGQVRQMSSGQVEGGQVARGGGVISDVEIRLTINHQDNEVFIGASRNSAMSKEQRSNPVWGAIRSTGDEALFVTGNSARGNVWFLSDTKFEFCLTGLTNPDELSAYCGILEKTN